jgi:hypothetical protein
MLAALSRRRRFRTAGQATWRRCGSRIGKNEDNSSVAKAPFTVGSEEQSMTLEALASADWRAMALLTIIAVAIVWGFVFFLRHNRQDLDSLRETLKSDREDDGE